MTDIVYLNGEFLPINEAKVSVLDRGFIFGDGVYEVIPVYGGHLFRLKQHINRLENSLASIRIPQPMTHDAWYNILTELITKKQKEKHHDKKREKQKENIVDESPINDDDLPF